MDVLLVNAYRPPPRARVVPEWIVKGLALYYRGMKNLCLSLVVALCLLHCRTPDPVVTEVIDAVSKEGIDPETATGLRANLRAVTASRFMAASANPHATRAGLEMLEEGGSAVDAAVAMAMVLTLVEPQSSGIGGGAFLLYYDADTQAIQAFDGRETAPQSARPDQFSQWAGQGYEGFMQAVVGGLSVGVPGELRMLELAHQTRGKLPWSRLFQPAIALCESGFEVSPRLHKLIARDPYLEDMPSARAYFLDGEGKALPAGAVLKNPALAQVLRAVAEQGADAFYRGEVAQDIARAVGRASRNPGPMTIADLATYSAVERNPVCGAYREFRVCGMPPPTSGGVTALQILGVLNHFDLGSMDPDSANVVHLFAEASRLAYADRDKYLADPDFVKMPVGGLLRESYLAERAGLITLDSTMGKASAGAPGEGAHLDWPSHHGPDIPSTSHIVAVDEEGNAITMTASIEGAFGSHVFVRGFLLNNELTDFSFVAEVDGTPVANRLEPGKRPRSSMAPLFVLNPDGSLAMAVGSPGGSRIILYVTRTILAVLDWGIDIQTAIERPNLINRNGVTEIEDLQGWEAWGLRVKSDLESRGHEVKLRDLNSGIQGIVVTPDGLIGGTDPRREGLVLGR
jgi:gamma-glutamyltranspeptidase/glutathione hydrolase